MSKAFLWLKAIVVAFLLLDFACTVSGKLDGTYFPIWFSGMWDLAIIAAVIRAERKPGGGITVAIPDAIQFLVATILIFAALFDLRHRIPQGMIAIIFYWEGLAWAWMSARSLLWNK